jgi:hypothetical protein
MLEVSLDKERDIAIIKPEGRLMKEDFDSASKIIDPHIERIGRLNGLIIYTKDFSGWESFASLSRHIEFVKDHHKKIKKIAFVTDSIVGSIAKNVSSHFVEAQIKNFDFDDIDRAKEWISE